MPITTDPPGFVETRKVIAEHEERKRHAERAANGDGREEPPPANGPQDYGSDRIQEWLRQGGDGTQRGFEEWLRQRSAGDDFDVNGGTDQQHTKGDGPRAQETTTDQPNEQGAPAGLGEWNAALDVDPPPPRGWLLGNTFCRTFLSSLIGAGGSGKTALRYAQALALATGRKLTNEHVFQRCRVLIVSLEDDANELRRRIRAARLHYDIPLSELDGWLFLAAPGAKAGKLMAMNQRGGAVAGNLGATLEAVVVARKIDLVMLDPFVKSHSVEENANTAIDDVVQILSDLATKHNIAVDTPHHVRKGQMEAGDADAGRGASALKDGSRLFNTCLPMSEEEAKAFGISQEDRRDYIRIDSGKVNIARRSRTAKWFRLVSVTLDNPTELYPNGDEVQTVEPWEPPKTWADLSDDALDLMLEKIDSGLPDGNLYSDANSAKDRAAWKVVQNVAPAKSEEQCREIIRTWIENDVLVKTPFSNPKARREQHGLKLSPWKRQEIDSRAHTRGREEKAPSPKEEQSS